MFSTTRQFNNFGSHFCFSLSLQMKMLIGLSHILVSNFVFHSFSLVLVDKVIAFYVNFYSLLLVKLQLPTLILVAILYVVFRQKITL